jgi:hypothetical protein
MAYWSSLVDPEKLPFLFNSTRFSQKPAAFLTGYFFPDGVL